MREFQDSIINLELENAINLCKEILSSKVVADEIFDAIAGALNIVGQRYEDGTYFLSELIMAGEVVKEVLKTIEPYFKIEERKTIATVTLATVRGDLHDIGKNIVAMLLRSSRFKVVDLGVDVSAGDIVKAVKDNDARLLGLSALLTTTVPEFRNVVEELRKAGIRDNVMVIVGGAAVNEDVAKRSGADAWGRTAVDGLKICKKWVEYEVS